MMASLFHSARFVWVAVFVIVGGFLISQDASVGGQAATQPGKGAGTPTQYNKLALLVGINDYKYKGEYLKPLRGAANDIKNMKRLLVERFGFPDDDDHILVLTDKQATRNAILKAIKEHLIAKATRDSIVVFHYSGHGSHVKDVDGDEIDGYDESLVPYDSGRRNDPGRDIIDDEINALLRRLTDKTANVTFIFDSCHSGTAIRGAGLARTVEPDDRPPTEIDPIAGTTARGMKVQKGKSGLRPEDSRYALIAGCAADEQSYETSVEGQSFGALTWCLVDQIRQAGGGTTYRDIMDVVKTRVSAQYRMQNPQLEGPGEDQFVFGDKSQEPAPYVLVKPGPGETLRLEAGQVHGVTKGSVYDIYPPGTKSFGKDVKPVAQVEVTEVDVIFSSVKVTKGKRVEEASRAVEREHHWSDPALRIYFKDLVRSKTLQAIKAKLREFKHITALEREKGYDLLLREHKDNKDGKSYIVTEGGDPTEISPRVAVTDPDAVSHVVEQVKQWAKWFNILHIANQQPELAIEFELSKEGPKTSGSAGAPGQQVSLTLLVGEKFKMSVTNKSQKDLYIALLDLSSDGGVEVVFPDAGEQEFLVPGKPLEIPLETQLPPGCDSMRNVLKLIATTSFADFGFLRQEAVRGGPKLVETRGPRNPLEELLGSAAVGTARGGVKRVSVGNWVTLDRVLEVRRKK